VYSKYLLRDILQFDNTLTDSMTRMTNAHRTCNLILGVGDGKVGNYQVRKKKELRDIILFRWIASVELNTLHL